MKVRLVVVPSAFFLALAMRRRLVSGDHADVATSLNTLAIDLLDVPRAADE